MDCSCLPAYVRLRMNLLLLLSALLSALSGLGVNVRAPVAVQAVAGVAAASPAVRAADRTAATRPVAGLPGLAQVAVARWAKAVPLPAAIPLWTTRRRE